MTEEMVEITEGSKKVDAESPEEVLEESDSQPEDAVDEESDKMDNEVEENTKESAP